MTSVQRLRSELVSQKKVNETTIENNLCLTEKLKAAEGERKRLEMSVEELNADIQLLKEAMERVEGREKEIKTVNSYDLGIGRKEKRRGGGGGGLKKKIFL